MFTSSLPRVHVVGANVYGYTSAILLILQGYKVTIIANHFPGDADYSCNYPDNHANSHWQTEASNSDAHLQQYDATSFKMFWKLAKCKSSESGIMIGSSFKYYQNPTDDQSNPWWKNVVPTFETIQNHELPEGVQLGHHYTTVLINTKRYLGWLQTQFLSMGGRQRRTAMNKILDVVADQDHVSMIVNCSDDLPLSTDALDTSLQTTYQQQWIIQASQIRNAVQVKTKDEEMYIYPRMDGTVVVGSSRRQQQDENSTQLLNRLTNYCPELTWGKGVDALNVMEQEKTTKSTRLHGPRVENQFIVTPLGTRLSVTHNYGHDGYQSSWGSSKCAVRLVNEAYANLKKDSQSVSELLSHL
ncbi:unnamed protein product [Absidia cylindrospora]